MNFPVIFAARRPLVAGSRIRRSWQWVLRRAWRIRTDHDRHLYWHGARVFAGM